MREVRHAIPDDAEALTEVAHRAIRETCAADGRYTPDEIEDWVSDFYPNNYLKWMANDELRLYAAVVDEVVQGVGLLDLEGEILQLYVLPEAQHQGLGQALLAEMEHEARYWDLPALRLIATPIAVAFFEHRGFKNLGPSGRALPSFKLEKEL